MNEGFPMNACIHTQWIDLDIEHGILVGAYVVVNFNSPGEVAAIAGFITGFGSTVAASGSPITPRSSAS